jgi:hypothetical protein
VEWCLRSLATFNEWPFTYYSLAAAYAYLGRLEEAAATVRRLREIAPHATIETVLGTSGQNDDEVIAALLPGLRKAGMPER